MISISRITSLFALFIVLSSCANGSSNSNENETGNFNVSSTSRIAAVTPKKFLFDATKAETAGNADWVISENSSGTPLRFPSPTIANVTATTPETYWQGGLSSWGMALARKGHSVESLVSSASITYGNTSNAQDLSHYDVFVVDEPNILFTSAQKTAIINFVKNGGGLFMISDHAVSDRNHDGKDSPAIWNDLMGNNSVQANPFGLTIELTNISETSAKILNEPGNKILNGSEGVVTQLKFNNGATIRIDRAANATAKGLIFQNAAAASGSTKIMCATATYFAGRVFLITDSSPADDGTGNPRDKLHSGWTAVNGNHSRLHLNASYWLAKLQ